MTEIGIKFSLGVSDFLLFITLHFQLCSASYTVLQTKNSSRTATAINPVTTENMDNFHLQTESHALCYRESTPWAVSRKKWVSKEDNGKSMMCALYIPRYAKRHVLEQIDIEQ